MVRRDRMEIEGTPLEDPSTLEEALKGELLGWKIEYQADGRRVLIWEPKPSDWVEILKRRLARRN